ncbi:N-acetylneuraminate synthase family protein [Thermosynechococcus sp. QKsg1]|uniref:N-acetylneuraminate synthase family protein n=1 Tax=Thermosynechococcus sp. QKsg1 TaxID=3074130 RepID=UPI0028779072|nr:N-acetylneuraminate synthase family protein [Thermosynechococcus sp. QKsg1]WNC86857.1 N-acetylneuraminate synthase family protein [Thermosynechococcus sp. QKsg1]
MALNLFNDNKESQSKVFIVAEIGSNHCQSIDIAKETIHAAKESGADAVKFQTLSLEHVYHCPSQEIIALHKLIDISNNFFEEIKKFSDTLGIDIFTAPTYLSAVDFLEKKNVNLYKIASPQVACFPQLIKKVAQTGKPILFSTGLATYSEVQRAVNIITQFHNRYIILHCNTIYPTPAKLVNLGRIKIYEKMFNAFVGFSDHTQGIHISLAAVAMGAKAIEKHFILDKKISTPDACVSLTPNEFLNMTKSIRDIEIASQSNPRTYLENEEIDFLDKVRYKLVLNKPKKKGDIFLHSDFSYKRATGGIDCSLEPIIIENFVARCDIESESLLEFPMLQSLEGGFRE